MAKGPVHRTTSRSVPSRNKPRPRPASDEIRSVAAYLADSSEELVGLARAARLDFLAYLLGMARLEAERTAGSRH